MGKKSDVGLRVISATEASRSFSAVLDGVERGERYLVERHGRPVGLLGPPAMEDRRISGCIARLQGREPVLLDPAFPSDLLDILATEPRDIRPWES